MNMARGVITADKIVTGSITADRLAVWKDMSDMQVARVRAQLPVPNRAVLGTMPPNPIAAPEFPVDALSWRDTYRPDAAL